jgi:hypothetical protein
MSSSWIPQQAGGSWGGGEPPVGSAAPGPVTSPLTAPMPAAPWSDGPGQDGVAQGAGAPPTWGQPSFYPGTGGGDGGSPVPGVSTLQRLSMQVTLALFSVVVIAPWAFFTWVVLLMFSFVGAAEPLEDMGGFEESVYYSGFTWAVLVVGVLAVWRVRTVLVDLRERSRLTAERLSDAAGAVNPKPPSTWKRLRGWLPSRGSWLAMLALAFAGLAWATVLEPTYDGNGRMGTAGVALMLLLPILAVVWLPWKIIQWSTVLIGWMDRTGQRSQYRCGLMMGGLLMGLFTLNPLVLPVTLGLSASAITEAVMDGVREGTAGESAALVPVTGIALAQARSLPGAERAGLLAASREALVGVARSIPVGREPEVSAETAEQVQRAWGQCYRDLSDSDEYERALRRVHRSGIYPPEDEPLVHTVAVSVCERYAWNGVRELAPYYNAAVSKAIKSYYRRFRVLEPVPDEVAGYSEDAESRAIAREEIERLRRAVRGRDLVILERMLNGESEPQIQSALALNDAAWRQALSRFRRNLATVRSD